MLFSSDEIEKAKELKRLGNSNSKKTPVWNPKCGDYVWSRHCPSGARSTSQENVFLIMEAPDAEGLIWLPTFDQGLEMARHFQISFSQITDYIHRRRFADGREREGLYQLLIEHLR